MTPVLQHLLKTAISLVKIEQRKGAEKIQEVYYVTDKVSPTEETWEHEEVVEEHAEELYEDQVAPLETMVVLSGVDVLSTTEDSAQTDRKSELRGEISVTDASQRKVRVTRKTVVPKTQEAVGRDQEDKDKQVTILKEEKAEEEFFIRTIESPAEEITDERKDSISVRHLPQEVSTQETSVTVHKRTEMSIEKSREKQMTEDTEFVKDKTKPSQKRISTEVKKQTQTLKIEKEVKYDESAEPEQQYSRAEVITAEQTQVKPTQVSPTRKDEPQMKPSVLPDVREDEISVFVKKHELTDKKLEKTLKSEETKTEKPKPEIDVSSKPKESVTDTSLKKPKVIKKKTETKTEAEAKRKEESKETRPQRVETEEKIKEDTKPSVPSKPEEKWTPPQTAARGTQSSNLTPSSSSLTSPCLCLWCRLFSFLAKSWGASHLDHFNLSTPSNTAHFICECLLSSLSSFSSVGVFLSLFLNNGLFYPSMV